MSNEVTKLIQKHRSIRKFTDEIISDTVMNELLNSAQWAPSSHNLQAYSIIVIKNKEKKKKLSEMCGNQKYVENCPVFLVFCTDFYRLKLTSMMHKTDFEINEVENILVGAVDTALAAENVYLAAKSFGLGGVMIGGIRNNPDKVASLLNLPELTVPIMGMCLGYPAQDVWQKPRLPQRVVVHNEVYQTAHLIDGLEEYEKISADYYTRRTNGQRTEGWTKQISKYLSTPRRRELTSFIINQGFSFK